MVVSIAITVYFSRGSKYLNMILLGSNRHEDNVRRKELDDPETVDGPSTI